MSISMTVRKKEQLIDAVPVATQASFGHRWEPTIKQCGLALLAKIGCGLSFTPTESPQVVDELNQLKEGFLAMLRKGTLTALEAEDLSQRIDRLIATIHSVRNSSDMEIYLG